ncbi:MAG: glycosyltransferase family 2 protein [Campylobacterales bacterium]|nr:glycosyltransferase family 2 protein [Campylobacterales bacterium]
MKKSNPLVSVIITTYNRYELLKIALQKVYEQSYTNLEVIVSDDCSTDFTCKIVEDFPLVRYLRTPKNIGYTQNSHFALSHATGAYVIFISDDDTLGDSLFFEKAVEQFEQNASCRMVISKTRIQTSQQSVLHHYAFKPSYSPREFFEWWMEVRSNFSDYFSLSSILFERNLLTQINAFSSLFEESSTIDASVIFKSATLAGTICFIDVVGYVWRFPEEDTLSNANRDDLVKQAQYNLAFVFDMEAFLKQNVMEPRLKEVIKQALNQRVEWVFSAILSEKERLRNHENFERFLKKVGTQDDIYIYGRGWTGLALKTFLLENGAKFNAFIDDFKTHFKDTIDFKTFQEQEHEGHVVISSYKYQDIYRIYKKLVTCKEIKIYDLLDD